MPARVKVELNNPALITWARETSGYSVEEIAAHFHKTPEDIRTWERGEDAPTYLQLEDFANKCKRPVAIFFLPEVPQSPPLPRDFRMSATSRAKPYSPKSLLAFRNARNRLEEVRDLLDSLEMPLVYALPQWSLEDNPVEKARELREQLGISLKEQMGCRDRYEALDLWRSVLFDLGVIVFVFNMPFEEVRAFCLLDHDLAAIGLNSKDPEYGRIFSIFHEIAHLGINHPGVSGPTDATPIAHRSTLETRVEDYCDRFAAAFLLPAHEPLVKETLRELSGDPTLECGRRLANRFKVSKYALLRRSNDLGMLPSGQYWQVYNDWREQERAFHASSTGGNAINNQVSRLGKRFSGMILEALDNRTITTYDAQQLLSLSPKHFERVRELTMR